MNCWVTKCGHLVMLFSAWMLVGLAWAALCFIFIWPIWDPDYGPRTALVFVLVFWPILLMLLAYMYIGVRGFLSRRRRLGLGNFFAGLSLILLALVWARLSFLFYYGRF